MGEAGASRSGDLALWYDKPAGDEWVRALPLGNGRLGAMVYGNPGSERIQLNEDTVWAGSPYRNDSPQARAKSGGLYLKESMRWPRSWPGKLFSKARTA
jgi:hypothetical protein